MDITSYANGVRPLCGLYSASGGMRLGGAIAFHRRLACCCTSVDCTMRPAPPRLSADVARACYVVHISLLGMGSGWGRSLHSRSVRYDLVSNRERQRSSRQAWAKTQWAGHKAGKAGKADMAQCALSVCPHIYLRPSTR
jgi:hypothetical protein